MRLAMQEADSPTGLTHSRWGVSIVGRALDDRGSAARGLVAAESDRTVTLEYDADTFRFSIDGGEVEVDDLDAFVDSLRGRSIVLEATTLGFVEIFLFFRALNALAFPGASIIYVEPRQYSSPRRGQLLHRREFELSDAVAGYRAIPGATLMLTDRRPQRGVFFLGYEEQRLDRALEDYPMIKPSHCSVVFGVPAFRPGWEMDAFANNIRVIRERGIRGGVHYCGAENPAAAFNVLRGLHRALQKGERLFAAPIGTKPCGIGCALFVAEHPDVGILYDHPTRRTGRSSQYGRWHLFNVDLTTP